jgi:hypothetical protein
MIPKSGNKNVDTAITIAVIILIVFVLNKILSILKNPFGTTPDTGLPLDPNDIKVDESKLNYPLSQYEIWATNIETAITGFYVSEDDVQSVRDVLYNINSDADLMQLIKAFGIQTSLGGLTGGNGDLVTNLRLYIPSKEFKGFNDHFTGWGMKLRI